MKRISIKNLVLSGLFIALGLVLPFFTAQIPSVGSRLLPMHIPVLISGFVCGWPLGLVVGFVTPLLRSLIFGMPPMFPTAIAMAFELGTYGLMAGLLYDLLPKKNSSTYISLILSMIVGRIIWGIASMFLLSLNGKAFTWQMFIAGSLVNAIPGIILQIILIPIVINNLKKARAL